MLFFLKQRNFIFFFLFPLILNLFYRKIYFYIYFLFFSFFSTLYIFFLYHNLFLALYHNHHSRRHYGSHWSVVPRSCARSLPLCPPLRPRYRAYQIRVGVGVAETSAALRGDAPTAGMMAAWTSCEATIAGSGKWEQAVSFRRKRGK